MFCRKPIKLNTCGNHVSASIWLTAHTVFATNNLHLRVISFWSRSRKLHPRLWKDYLSRRAIVNWTKKSRSKRATRYIVRFSCAMLVLSTMVPRNGWDESWKRHRRSGWIFKKQGDKNVLGIRFIWFWAKHLRADIQPFWQTMCSICTDWCHSCWGIGSRYPCRWGLSAICLTGNFYCYALKQIYRNMILVETFLGVCNMKSVSINSWEHHQLLRRRNRLIITSLCMVSCEGRKQLHPTSRVWKKQNVVRDSGKHSFLAVSNLFVHSKKCLAWYRLNLPRRAVLSGHMFWRSQRHSLSWTMSASIGVSCARDLGTRLLAQNILFHDISQGVLASNGDSL